MIPYGRQEISEEDIEAVVSVLRSDFLTQGSMVPSFEKSVAGFCGANFAVAVNSATSALHLSCLALGVGRGDIVWTAANTFVASANCALYCGASVDFVDIDLCDLNMSIPALEIKLEIARKANKLPKLVIPVHFSGFSCDMAEISRLSEKFGFRVLEDASHAIGGSYRDKLIGSCFYSDAVVFSFHPVKIITSGEGGMILTNSIDLYRAVNLLRSHGVVRSSRDSPSDSNPWEYWQEALGFNYRMTDIQASLGLSQLSRINGFISRRRDLVARYDQLLSELPIVRPSITHLANSAWHLYPIWIDAKKTDISRSKLFERMQNFGVGVNVHYKPVYLHPFFKRLGFLKGLCPNAETYYENALSLPIFPAMTYAQQDHIVDSIKAVFLK